MIDNKNILVQLFYFLELEAESEALRPLLSLIGSFRLRVLASKLVPWLGSRAQDESLAFSRGSQWAGDLRLVLKHSPELAELLEVREDNIQFREELAPEIVVEIRRVLSSLYKPRLSVYRRTSTGDLSDVPSDLSEVPGGSDSGEGEA